MNAFRGDSALSDIELEEKFSKRSLNQGITSRLLPLIAPVWQPIAAVIGIELVQVLAIFTRPLLLGLVIDRGLRQAAIDARLILWACVGLAATWGLRFVLGGLSQYCAGTAAIRFSTTCAPASSPMSSALASAISTAPRQAASSLALIAMSTRWSRC